MIYIKYFFRFFINLLVINTKKKKWNKISLYPFENSKLNWLLVLPSLFNLYTICFKIIIFLLTMITISTIKREYFSCMSLRIFRTLLDISTLYQRAQTVDEYFFFLLLRLFLLAFMTLTEDVFRNIRRWYLYNVFVLYHFWLRDVHGNRWNQTCLREVKKKNMD